MQLMEFSERLSGSAGLWVALHEEEALDDFGVVLAVLEGGVGQAVLLDEFGGEIGHALAIDDDDRESLVLVGLIEGLQAW